MRVRVPYGGAWVWEGVPFPSSAAGLRQAARHRQEVIDRTRLRMPIDWCEWFPESSRCRPPVEVDERTEPTFAEAVRDWMRRSRSHLADSTAVRYRQHFDAVWLPPFGRRLVSQIRQGDVIDVIAAKGWTNGGTQEKALAPLRSVLEAARRDGWVTINVAEGIKTMRHQTSGPDPLGWSEVAAVLHALDNSPWWPYFAYSFASGARPSELAALRWSDVDFTGGSVSISRGTVGGIEGPTKTARERRVPMLPLARAALERQALVTGQGSPSEHVFRQPATGKPLKDPQAARHHWRAACKAAGVRHRKAYVTRHTFATRLIMTGTHFAKVAAWLGHASPSMTLDAYTRWIDGEIAETLTPEQAWRVPSAVEIGPAVFHAAESTPDDRVTH